jgi:hypothetical protein
VGPDVTGSWLMASCLSAFLPTCPPLGLPHMFSLVFLRSLDGAVSVTAFPDCVQSGSLCPIMFSFLFLMCYKYLRARASTPWRYCLLLASVRGRVWVCLQSFVLHVLSANSVVCILLFFSMHSFLSGCVSVASSVSLVFVCTSISVEMMILLCATFIFNGNMLSCACTVHNCTYRELNIPICM